MNKTIHDAFLQICKFALYSFFFLLSSFFFTAQNYDWDWAMSGGGMYNSETIYDIKVGSDNNYYFIGDMKNGTPQLDGVPVTIYNNGAGGTDIFLFSTTCDGTVRWSQAIGGGDHDRAYNLALDSNDNVYVGTYVRGYPSFPVFFSPTDSVPSHPHPDYYKQTYLVKYDSNGQYQGRKALQGNVDQTNNQSQIIDIFIDSNDIIHFVAGFRSGTHLDNNVTVPNTIAGYQYFLTKYDTDLNYISSMLLPVADMTGFQNSMRFIYDENLNRYYIAGSREDGSNLSPLTYNNKPVINRSYILAFDGSDGSEVWRREIYTDPPPNNPSHIPFNRIYSLALDDNSDVYFGGQLDWRNFHIPGSIMKIYDPNDSGTDYVFTPNAMTNNMPFLVRLNSQGTVQWVKTPELAPNYSSAMAVRSKGIALRGNEVALGSHESYFKWDSFVKNNPLYFQADATLLRFDKQTGTTIGMHDIKGSIDTYHQVIQAVAVYNDGNYVTGGSFEGSLFVNPGSNIPMISSQGKEDFFVAKLAASVCGTAVSVADFNKLKVNVYPNPTNNIVNIETDEQLSNYIIYDVSGRQIQSNLFAGSNQINLQNVTTGVYFIKVTTVQGSSATVRVVKQ
ncbi:MAG: T9SS type A sorting domain-containing protein [Balneolaceae bacterium]